MKTKILFPRFILATLLLLVAATSVSQAEVVVTNTDDSGPGSLRQAIASAIAGDTITFSLPANSVITLTSGELLINKNLTINGPGADQLTVQRSNAADAPDFRIFHVNGNINVTISGMTISNGRHTSRLAGGGILNWGGTLGVENSTVSDNFAGGGAGGIYNLEGTLNLSNSTISNNGGEGSGGGVTNLEGNVNITNSTISGNSAPGRGGGGIYNRAGIITITNCAIAHNTTYTETAADGEGGGIYNQRGTIILTNTTVSNNHSLDGGGIYNDLAGAVLDITNSTISSNRAPAGSGGGIANLNTSSIRSRNTIIAQNTSLSGPDIRGVVTSVGFNLIGNNKDASIASTVGDQIGTADSPIDPKLGPLQNNGGPTPTHAPLSHSPAVDKGHSSGFLTDQRGLTRSVDDPGVANASGGDGADIGAHELQADELPGCKAINRIVNNMNDSGAGSLREVIASVCPGSTITFAENVRGTIALTSRELLINKNLVIHGPGANLLTVRKSSAAETQDFRIISTAPGTVATVRGLTLAYGFARGNTYPAGYGGGIYNHRAQLTLIDCAIYQCAASLQGGGIYNDGYKGNASLTLINCTLDGNSVGGSGAGIFNSGFDGRASATLTNSTLAANSAAEYGGGIYSDGTNNGNASLQLTNCTVGNNSAGIEGAGIVADGFDLGSSGVANVNLANTMLSSGAGEANLLSDGATFISGGHNLSNDAAGGPPGTAPGGYLNAAGDRRNTDPKLDPDGLADNGGPTRTIALQSDSPGINAGGGRVAPPTDQRGFPRVGLSDIGAFEFGSSLPTPTPTPTPRPVPGLVANFSTRLPVGTDDNVLIEGFIVQGPEGSTKKIIVRAIGPALAPFGIDALGNPMLEIRDANNAVIATNDDWGTTQVEGIVTGDQSGEIAGSGLAPSDGLESAIIAELAPGRYTAVVSGVGNTVGIGVVDAYDLSPDSPARLANIATRGLVQPGDQLMIAGFIIQQGDVRAAVRAVGPSLAGFGISNALPDTTLQLRDRNGAIVIENDDWQSDPAQKQELEDVGLQPSDAFEAAVIATIPPGQYTVEVRGKPETTGIGVVQLFFLQ